MGNQFEHLRLPRIINIELPRRATGGGFGGTKRTDVSEHGKQLLGQISSLIEPVKQKISPFRLDPKLIFKIKVAEKHTFSDNLVTQIGLLIIEDQVLMVIQYWREYRTYYHIGLDFGLSEAAVCRIVFKIENILIKSRNFSLPGKKELWKMSSEEDLVVMDVTESPIEKPQKGQKRFFSGKQGEHTLKTQVIIHQKSSQIICLAHGLGRIHDFKLFKTSSVRFGELLKVIADKGYQGINKIHQLSETPIKKPKGKKLTKEHKKYNRELNRLRIAVEHVNRRLKIFKILSERYRNRHRRFGLRSNLIAGIYNHELAI